MRNGLKGVIALLVIVAILVLPVFSSYNGLVVSDEAVNSAWSQVENQLQRRMDLIPNLVNTVKGYASHEEKIFTSITQARAKFLEAKTVTEKDEAYQQFLDVYDGIKVIIESNPEIKADANFRQLHDSLEGTENRINVARMDYNNAVQTFNTKIRRFPTVIIARMFGFEMKDYFKAAEGAKQAPTVDFNNDSK